MMKENLPDSKLADLKCQALNTAQYCRPIVSDLASTTYDAKEKDKSEYNLLEEAEKIYQWLIS